MLRRETRHGKKTTAVDRASAAHKKKWFVSLPSGYYICTNTHPFRHIELTEDRERDWRQFRTRNTGRLVYSFSNKKDCLESIAASEALRIESIQRRGRKVDPGKIFKAYLDADTSLPRDPQMAKHLPPGLYADKLTKKLLMTLPTGTRLVSRTYSGEPLRPVFEDVVPPLPERQGFWLLIKNQGVAGRTFDIVVPYWEKGRPVWLPVPYTCEGGRHPRWPSGTERE